MSWFTEACQTLPSKSPRGTSYSNMESPGLHVLDSNRSMNQSAGHVKKASHISALLAGGEKKDLFIFLGSYLLVPCVSWLPFMTILVPEETGDDVALEEMISFEKSLWWCRPDTTCSLFVDGHRDLQLKVLSFLRPVAAAHAPFFQGSPDGELSLRATLASVRGLLVVVKKLLSKCSTSCKLDTVCLTHHFKQ